MADKTYSNKAYYDIIYQTDKASEEDRQAFYRESAIEIRDSFSPHTVLKLG